MGLFKRLFGWLPGDRELDGLIEGLASQPE